jgi:hypothetical protein
VERPAFSNPPLSEAADGRYGPITFRGSRSSWTKSKQHQSLGYPHDLNTSSEQREVMTGGSFDQIDYLTHVVA